MEGYPEFLKPRLRLFLSADIVGSTALKQSPRSIAKASSEWFPVIQGFYLETQREFSKAWEAAEREDQSRTPWGPKPELWKVIGDEIVFAKHLTDNRQLACTLSVWLKAVDMARAFVKTIDPRLDVKCTAWTAGFPVMNKEVVVATSATADISELVNYYKDSGRILERRYSGDNVDGFTVDYVGPSIDIGFRLATQATARRFVVSVGVAYILSMTNRPAHDHNRLPALHYAGATPLKGVFGGASYPIFWLDMAKEGELERLEDKLLVPRTTTNDDIHKFCAQFFSVTSAYTFPPFIFSETEAQITVWPTYYEEKLAALAENYAFEVLPDKESEEEAEKQSSPTDEAGQLDPKVAISQIVSLAGSRAGDEAQ